MEISVDGRVAWTNDDRRGYIPEADEVIQSLRGVLR